MSSQCPSAPTNKKEYITDVGKILVAEHGRKKFYSPEEVKTASKKSKRTDASGIDWHCWAMCTYSSHEDFDAYHELTGETCDYIEMKTEMLSGIASSSSSDWFTLPDLDFDASWLEFDVVFEGLLEGIGEFIAGIFD